MAEEQSDTELVLAARDDDPAAFGQLFERWFDRAWNVARAILRDDDLAADVAQDAMVKAWQQLDQLENPDAFGGWLLRSTRNRALNRLAREGRSRASGDDVVSGLRDRGAEDPVGAERLPQPDLVNEIRDRQELVWAAATALGERDASLLDLHLRHGLSPAEIAEELGVEANAAHQQLFRLRNRLGDAIGSYLLWRNGRPLCDGLADAVSGRTAFDRSVARSVARHQASCEHCSEQRESLVDPAKLFAAVPLLLVPPHLKAEAVAALQSAGVPTDASGASGPGSGADSGASSGSGSEGAAPDGASTAGAETAGPDGASASDPAANQHGGSAGGESAVGDPGVAGAQPSTAGPTISPAPEGIRLDLGPAPGQAPAPVGAGAAPASGFTLANEAAGAAPGPALLAPALAVSRTRAMALA
ncbi:MAG: sigma-70 family RNA polymerase sigma factor, partial [Actinomycetota bacterium]